MTPLLALGAVAAVLAIGVAAMLWSDRRQEKRVIENGGRRFS